MKEMILYFLPDLDQVELIQIYFLLDFWEIQYLGFADPWWELWKNARNRNKLKKLAHARRMKG